MVKLCKYCKTNPVFSHDFCKYHQFRRYMRGGDLHKPTKVKKKPPKESNKRKKERIRYTEQIKMFWDDAVENNTNFCFFCGEKMKKRDNIHHLKGRTGDYYLDKEWWVNAHNKCHTEDYHHANYEQKVKQKWYQDFLLRLKDKSEELYRKEIKKEEKARKELFDDEISI